MINKYNKHYKILALIPNMRNTHDLFVGAWSFKLYLIDDTITKIPWGVSHRNVAA